MIISWDLGSIISTVGVVLKLHAPRSPGDASAEAAEAAQGVGQGADEAGGGRRATAAPGEGWRRATVARSRRRFD